MVGNPMREISTEPESFELPESDRSFSNFTAKVAQLIAVQAGQAYAVGAQDAGS
jgi:hypothetical protein